MSFFKRFVGASFSALALHLRRFALEWILAVLAVASMALCMYLLIAPPAPYPRGQVVVITENSSAATTARELGEAGIVRYPELLRLYWRVSGEGRFLHPGAYRFAYPETIFTIGHRIAVGDYGIPSIRITFPEGSTVLDMAQKVMRLFPEIRAADFISAAGPYEGYLFPDTYTFQASVTATAIVSRMRSEFDEKTAPLAGDIASSHRSLSDLVIMASIVEREAATKEDRHMVAGVLWNRVDKSIPLQVDAVFGYIYSRQTYSPSYHDLGVDSPYNTYHHAGLPPGPISNPGLGSLDAALHPTPSKYLYYLTGRDGLMHYATTYQGHKANLTAYLR